MSNFKALALLGASLVAVSACGHSPESIAVANGDHREIQVKEQTHYLELTNVEVGHLTTADRARVAEFASIFANDGYGPITVSAPEGSRAAFGVVTSIRSILSQAGVLPANIAVGDYVPNANDGAPLIMAFKTYEAHVPGCSKVNEHDWTKLSSNSSLPSFGCAVNENIAMMIAKPGDLLGERELGPGDSSRQLTVYEKYRLGENTASSREADGGSTQN